MSNSQKLSAIMSKGLTISSGLSHGNGFGSKRQLTATQKIGVRLTSDKRGEAISLWERL